MPLQVLHQEAGGLPDDAAAVLRGAQVLHNLNSNNTNNNNNDYYYDNNNNDDNNNNL